MSDILGYFLTWTTYGTWLPGDDRGWVDRHRKHGQIVEPPSPALESHARRWMKETPVVLDEQMRQVASAAMRQACGELGWTVHALEVRSNHVHAVVTAQDARPGKVMGVLKVHGTKALNALMATRSRNRWWTKDGSKRILNSQETMESAIRYVNNQDVSWMKQM